ncbi:AAA family ATPase [Endozoicomonas sp. ALB115]|uniref:AAA family ATPase n=2 Tax=unclassified Endozoicomonas TaxID=2644528 RepID=UPI003BB5ADF2
MAILFGASPDFARQFAHAMNDAGLRGPELPVADGKIQRFHVEGDKPGKKNGWYVLYGGRYPAGSFGSWKTGDKHVWSLHDHRELSAEEFQEQERIMAMVRAEREREQQKVWADVARASQDEWEQARAADPEHPYLVSKGVGVHGIRQREQTLLIPVHDEQDAICSLQYIWQDEQGQFQKRYKTGGKKAGGLHLIGEVTDTLYQAEGYSTAATIHEVTGCGAVVSFDSGNLEAVARRLQPVARQRIIAADNDSATPNNPGLTAAIGAAQATGATVVFPQFPPGSAGTDFNDLKQVAPELMLEQLKAPSRLMSSSFSLVSVGEMVSEPRPISWLIKGFLETDSLALMFGEPGCGKSFVAIDMACCIATGNPWHGAEIKRPGPVIYLAGEGLNGLSRRFKAWEITNGQSLAGAPLFVSKCAASLYDAASAAQVCQAVEIMVEQNGGQPPSTVVVDTLARNFGGADENSTQDMNQFVRHLDDFFRRKYGCCVLIVHHTGVGSQDRARGNSALKAALDAEYAVRKTDDTVKITSKKMKDADEPDPREFNLKVVELPWQDEDGEVQTSCVLEDLEAPAVQNLVRQAKTMGKTKKAAIALLGDLYETHRQRLQEGGRMDCEARVSFVDWRDACLESNPPVYTHRNNFNRDKKFFEDSKIIRIDGPYVYLVEGC